MLGPHCTENPPSLSSTFGAGNVQQIGGLQTYVTGSQDSKLAILLAADAFGIFNLFLDSLLTFFMPQELTFCVFSSSFVSVGRL